MAYYLHSIFWIKPIFIIVSLVNNKIGLVLKEEKHGLHTTERSCVKD
jgi:hypothetical protein